MTLNLGDGLVSIESDRGKMHLSQSQAGSRPVHLSDFSIRITLVLM